ncbi:BatA domain-containing protein [Dyadobacter aurulentus]|uniref:BatA domain-containing protein n=1 Tax=Dyadobacter sp. UC 10 TaxID=2605428 RepID=UPI0011F0A48E|nr:BatA domain-containing protein [Dyadobacter sp. UC 10]KAA0992490.1 hypothetical protein FXO21_21125 [Dyadobacter sp. UC 10]
MEFLQPWMLWGATGVILPIAIHFWYQKKGEVIEWAASRWLFDETSLKHRGIRLHEILLSLIRCLLVLLLALILSQPILNNLKNSAADRTVHIVEPDPAVVNNYRFELENAKKAGEKVIWINKEAAEMKTTGDIPRVNNPVSFLQNTINTVSEPGVKYKIYLNSSQKLLNYPKIYVPGVFSLHPATDPASGGTLPYLAINSKEKLAIDPQTGILHKIAAEPAGYRFAEAPVHSGKFDVLVRFQNSLEGETVKAAIGALGEVYQIPFNMDEKETAGKKYDWVLSDQVPGVVNPQSLYVISGQASPVQHERNVHYLPDSLRLSASELVQNGRLPEWLGEIMTTHYGLNENGGLLSIRQLQGRFVEVKPAAELAADSLRRWLLLLLVLLTMLERWLALRKSTPASYG